MVPLPRVPLPLHCLVVISRFYKTAGPPRNWIMNTGRHPRGLPPQYPYTRRGSNTPVSSLAAPGGGKPPTPNRSRSLDGLLDAEPPNAASQATEQTPSQKSTKSCDDLDKDFDDDDGRRQTEDFAAKLDSVKPDNVDVVSIQSGSSDSKRKRNFMDRCVNKVRSLIKK